MSSICGYNRGRTPASTCGPRRRKSRAGRPSSIAPTRAITLSVEASVEPRRRNLTFSHASSARRRREIMPARAAALAQKNPDDPDISVRSRSKKTAEEEGDGDAVIAIQPRSAVDAQDDRVALATAGADGRDAEPAATTAQLVDDRAEDAGARSADRVAERDRAAVDVDAVLLDAELADRLQRHGGEGLVDLPQVDVAGLQAGPVERALGRARGRGGEVGE